MKIIIDLWNQHGGDINELKRMIVSGWMNGADAVKPQIFTSVLRRGDDIRKYLEVTYDQTKEIYDFARGMGIEIFSTVFDEEKLEWVDSLGTDTYKIASETIKANPKLCEKILSRNKLTYISTGGLEINEFPFGHDKNIRYLFCVAKYPTYLYDKALKQMPSKFSVDGYYGYSDHAVGIVAALESYRRGSMVLEKHYTHTIMAQNAQEGAHMCSFTPESLRQFRQLYTEYEVFNGKNN